MPVIDLDAARKRFRSTPANPVLEALDELALALSDYGHVWTDPERALYETAISYLCRGGID
jgi:hypothetical protein